MQCIRHMYTYIPERVSVCICVCVCVCAYVYVSLSCTGEIYLVMFKLAPGQSASADNNAPETRIFPKVPTTRFLITHNAL